MNRDEINTALGMSIRRVRKAKHITQNFHQTFTFGHKKRPERPKSPRFVILQFLTGKCFTLPSYMSDMKEFPPSFLYAR